MAGMYSLNDITNGCPIKIETTVSSCNGQSNGIISIGGMPVLKAEKSDTSCTTVDHHTISLPQESIYEVALNPDEDVLSIQISNVQGATSDHNAATDELITVNHVQLENHAAKGKVLTVNQIANHVEKLGQEVQSRFEADPQTKIPLAESFPGGQQSKNMPEQRYPVEPEVQSPVNQSSVHNGEGLNKTAEQQKELPFQLNSHEPEIMPSYHLSHQPDISQMNNQYPSSAYQMNTNGTMSAYQVDTHGTLSSYQNGSPEIVTSYQISTNQTNMSLPSVYTSTPLYHMSSQGEIPASQPGNFETNTSYQMNHHTEMPAYYGGYNSYNPQHIKQFSQTETHGMVPNQQRSAHNCNCCCHAQKESSHYPAFGVEAPRPSVIMVPVNRFNTSPSTSHVPFKVDPSSYTLSSQNVDFARQDFANRMDYSDDSDSSDDEDETRKQKKYFRKNIDGTTARFKLSKEDWARIPINTFPSGGRLLSGDWTRIFLSKVKESNPWCSLRFKNNHVRSENSRKIHSAVFFRGGAECKRPECNVKVRFVIRKEKGKHVDVTYVGDVCHDSQPGRSDVIDDRKRKKVVRRTCST
ncbi:hypothetical protein ACROYT_G004144 [Oculina patagonica]